jgi:hypothetical protein
MPSAFRRNDDTQVAMLVGHIGAGLLVKRFEPRLNLGAVLLAALFADLLLWTLMIFGVESLGTPATAGSARFFTFDFPYSHGLVASVIWSVLAAAAGWFIAARGAARRSKLALALSLAVFSHFMLDLIVHVPDLPLVGQGSPKLGLGLWREMPIALAIELTLAAVALVLYLGSARPARAKALLVVGTVAVAAVLTAVGPYVPGEPPPPNVLALSSLLTLCVMVLLGFVADRRSFGT